VIDLGINPGRLHSVVPYQLPDFGQGGAVVEHLGCKGMAEKMSTLERGIAPGPCEGTPDDRTDALAIGQAADRGPSPEKDLP
jgi:hypothetical protein